MRRTLETARPVVFLELHGPEAAQAAWDTFTISGYGYTLHRLSTGYPKVRTYEDLQWKAYLVALPERPAQSQEENVRDGVWPRL
jgi:hypothetical protein